ncbi:hypothetical protein ACROYT_G015865 [Oculina patagonica]
MDIWKNGEFDRLANINITDVKFGQDASPSKGLYVDEVAVTASRGDEEIFFCLCWTGNEDKLAQETRTSQKLNVNHLVQAASNVLDFLEEVDEFSGLYAGPILRNAIRRYEVFWLPLAAKQGKESRLLAAPLDIAWVWHVHMLAPDSYEQDCLNIVSQVIDHTPMNRYQREEGLQRARHLWETTYPEETFEVDLTKPIPFVMPDKLKIQHDLEKACYHQSKFYYQVSLPHYADLKFLAKAVERYEHHLILQGRNRCCPVIPCYDVHLIRRSHKQFPLNYKQVITEMFEAKVKHDDDEASVSLGSTPHDLETSTRAVLEEEGFRVDKPGTMYRGEPLPHRPQEPGRLYVPLTRLECDLRILKLEILNSKATKTFHVRLFDPKGSFLLFRKMKGGHSIAPMNQCHIDNEREHAITVRLLKESFFGIKLIGSCETSMMSYLESLNVGGSAPAHPWIIDVHFKGSKTVVRLTVLSNHTTVVGYRFMIPKTLGFKEFDTFGTVLDGKKRKAFEYHVVRCSAVKVLSSDNVILASANTVNPSILPEKESFDGEERCVALSLTEGERAMLIRGRKDWGICIGKWKKNMGGLAGDLVIKFFSLHGKKGWCLVNQYWEEMFSIYFDSSMTNYVEIDLTRGKFNVSPASQNIPEAIALAFSVSILYQICKPVIAAKGARKPRMLAAAGCSTSVPTHYYTGQEAFGSIFDCGSHDFGGGGGHCDAGGDGGCGGGGDGGGGGGGGGF